MSKVIHEKGSATTGIGCNGTYRGFLKLTYWQLGQTWQKFSTCLFRWTRNTTWLTWFLFLPSLGAPPPWDFMSKLQHGSPEGLGNQELEYVCAPLLCLV